MSTNGKTPRRGKQAAASVHAREAESKALVLRRSGTSYPEIAKQLNVSISTAYTYVNAVLERTAAGAVEDREHLRRLTADRLDRAQLNLWPRVEKGDLAAVGVWLRLEDRRARLLGLDAASRQEITGLSGPPPVEVSLSAREALRAKIEDMAQRGTEKDLSEH